jgi:uncharacterized membrane protein
MRPDVNWFTTLFLFAFRAGLIIFVISGGIKQSWVHALLYGALSA